MNHYFRSMSAISKVIIVITMSMISCGNVQGQRGLQKKNALRYYDAVSRAELAICDGQINTAFEYYRKAFAINAVKPFSPDLMNAFYTAMDTRQYAQAEQWMGKMLKRGISARWINSLFYQYYKNSDSLIISVWLQKYPNDTLQHRSLSDSVVALVSLDQATRRYFSKLRNGDYMTDSVYRTDQQNAKTLLNIFKQYGYMTGGATTGNARRSPWDIPEYDILVTHHKGSCIKGYETTLFDTLMYKSVFSYDLRPMHFSAYMSKCTNVYAQGNFISGTDTLQLPLTFGAARLGDTLYFRKMTPAFVQRLNYNRAKIGLCSVEDLIKQTVFYQQHHENKFNVGNGIFNIGEAEEMSQIEKWQQTVLGE